MCQLQSAPLGSCRNKFPAAQRQTIRQQPGLSTVVDYFGTATGVSLRNEELFASQVSSVDEEETPLTTRLFAFFFFNVPVRAGLESCKSADDALWLLALSRALSLQPAGGSP